MTSEKTLPMTIDNTAFMLDRLGQDCHPLQFLRELTQNAIEAIGRTPEKHGEIIWDVDWISLDLGDKKTYKLSITDNGDGMTGPEMVKYINQLSSSIAKQSFRTNYGVGAKIAAAPRNHAGLIYLSWKEGEGSMIHLWRDPQTQQYGLRQIQRPDGSYGHYGEVEDTVKPKRIKEHGTMVILMGNSPEEDTIEAPPNARSPSRWIAKYLNSRYFQLPKGITVKAREGWQYTRSDKDRNLLREVTGQKTYLEKQSVASGTVQLTNANVHWWILNDSDALTQNCGLIESSGHTAILYENELYEMATGRSATARLQGFGVILGHRRVVIYVEPLADAKAEITTNTARTHVLINSQPSPWADWTREFRQKMPEEISKLIEQVAAGSTARDYTKAVRDRLKAIRDLFKLSRYRPSRKGDLTIDTETTTRGGQPKHQGGESTGAGGRSGTTGGQAGNVYSVFLKVDGIPGRETQPDPFPEVRWISTTDGTRAEGDLEDRAARFRLEQNLLLINADFRVFTDMVDWCCRERKCEGGVVIQETVKEVVQSWFQQTLTETVIGVQALQNSQQWSDKDIRNALSEEALTAAVMPRYHIHNCSKRDVAIKLGRLRAV